MIKQWKTKSHQKSQFWGKKMAVILFDGYEYLKTKIILQHKITEHNS